MGVSFEERLEDIRRFYRLLDELETKCGGKRLLKDCNGRMKWPKRGVYFFFENGELRKTSGKGLRVVRVGTHALNEGVNTTLWNRLRQHRGNKNGEGNHRGTVFRAHIGNALIKRDDLPEEVAGHWNKRGNLPRSFRDAERPLERVVSRIIGNIPLLWLEVDDPPGPGSQRGVIEKNAIGLLSNCLFPDEPIDPPRQSWLGRHAKNEDIWWSGLWNVDHVCEGYDSAFLYKLKSFINP